MPQNFYTILTQTGAADFATAQVYGVHVPVTMLAVGDGGGQDVLPTEAMSALVHEVFRIHVSSIEVAPENPSWLIVEAVIPANVGGWTIREIGLIGGLNTDDIAETPTTPGEKLLAVGNFPATYKPLIAEGAAKDLSIRMIVEVANAAAVQLTIDPSVVVATKKNVEQALAAHRTEANPHPALAEAIDALHSAATETAAGLIELATAAETTAGSDTTRAVTPKTLATELGKKANLASPALTGTPTAPTAASGTNTTQLATTAFVKTAISSIPAASETAAGLIELATAAETTAGSDTTRAVTPKTLATELGKKANLASPALTGTPTAPTAGSGTDTTQLATTAFVKAAISAAGASYAPTTAVTGASSFTSGGSIVTRFVRANGNTFDVSTGVSNCANCDCVGCGGG
jgi:phage-related tail fiber protein